MDGVGGRGLEEVTATAEIAGVIGAVDNELGGGAASGREHAGGLSARGDLIAQAGSVVGALPLGVGAA